MYIVCNVLDADNIKNIVYPFPSCQEVNYNTHEPRPVIRKSAKSDSNVFIETGVCVDEEDL